MKVKSESEVAQSCLTMCDPMDCSPLSFSVHGILQARILERVAISFSRDLSDPGIKAASLVFPALADGFLPLYYLGSPGFRVILRSLDSNSPT